VHVPLPQEAIVTAKRIRDGVGGKAYRRQSQALKRKAEREGMVCVWCKQGFDFTLPRNHPMAFTMDHPVAVGNGGSLTGQVGEPMHRGCNSKKGDSAPVDLGEWGAS
jgi:hypothetical protein